MNPTAYLDRIDYQGPLDPTAETLRRIHVAHMLSVPFENLSIHAGEPIVLDDADLFDKIVTRRRGGFCYELNGLFAWLLRSLGFRVTMIAAEVMNASGEWGPPFDHMALIVDLESRWLADVGFGDSFVEPLKLQPHIEQIQGSGAYRLDRESTGFVVMRRQLHGDWQPQYRFDLTAYEYASYAAMCHYHQTSPESHFTRNRVCSLATGDGRITLSGMRLITTRGPSREERAVDGDAAYRAALLDHFGIVMSGGSALREHQSA